MNFSWAMDLDPKGANNQIKEAIDKRYVNDEDEPATGGCKLHFALLFMSYVTVVICESRLHH